MKLKIIFSILLFIITFLCYSRSLVVNSIDSMWVIHTAHSLVNEGNLNLNEFREEVSAKDRYGVRKRNNNIYNYFPYGTSIVAVPFVFLFDLAPNIASHFVAGVTQDHELHSLSVRLALEKSIASFVTALIVVLVFLIGMQYLDLTKAFLLSVVFAFSTPAWSVLSRGLWQHGPSVLMHTACLLLMIEARKIPRLVMYTAPFLVFSFMVRPTNAVAIIAYMGFIFLYHRSYFIKHALLMALFAVPFIAINLEVFGKIVPQYFNPNRLEPQFNAVMPILANLISPSRGLLFLSPVFFFSFLAFTKKYKTYMPVEYLRLCYLSLGVISLHIIIVSIFPNWWGGHCFGARYMSDLITYFTFLLIPFLKNLSFKRQLLLTAGFIAAVFFGIWVHYRGANAQITFMWNVYPVNIDNNPMRVWNIDDIQVLRGL